MPRPEGRLRAAGQGRRLRAPAGGRRGDPAGQRKRGLRGRARGVPATQRVRGLLGASAQGHEGNTCIYIFIFFPGRSILTARVFLISRPPRCFLPYLRVYYVLVRLLVRKRCGAVYAVFFFPVARLVLMLPHHQNRPPHRRRSVRKQQATNEDTPPPLSPRFTNPLYFPVSPSPTNNRL